MSKENNIELARAFYEAFEEDNLDAALDLLDEDIVWEFQGPKAIPYTGIFRGKEQVAGFFKAISEYVEAEEFNVEEFLAEGDNVVVLGDERMRVKSTGQTFSMGWADIFTFKDGRLVRFREYTDTGAMLLAYQGG